MYDDLGRQYQIVFHETSYLAHAVIGIYRRIILYLVRKAIDKNLEVLPRWLE